MKPLKNFVLVADTGEQSKTTAGGIILQSVVESGSKPGFVVNIGPNVERVEPHDKVALDWSKGMPVTVEGERAILISEEFIYGIY